MTIDIGDIRSTLNDLIEICKDSQEGFRDAAEKLKTQHIRQPFLTLSLQRAQFAGELQAEVLRLGSEPAKSGSTAGAIHRGWMDLKSAFSRDTDHAILEEAERGEDAAIKAYRNALSKDLPADLHGIILRQYREVQQAHNNIRDLRDALRPGDAAPMAGLV
jgi:uncharacterized protein (TIGR02284 family)